MNTGSMIHLPLFPLNTVLFPGGILPLRIFETRYMDMVRKSMREVSPGFIVVAIRSGSQTSPDGDFYSVGTRAVIIDWEQRTDGLLGILAEGQERVIIHSSTVEENGLIVGEVETLPELSSQKIPESYLPLGDFLKRIIQQLGLPWSRLHHQYDDSSWVSGRLGELLPLDLDVRQAMLEEEDPQMRLQLLQSAMTKTMGH